jgi:hypothetical protein
MRWPPQVFDQAEYYQNTERADVTYSEHIKCASPSSPSKYKPVDGLVRTERGGTVLVTSWPKEMPGPWPNVAEPAVKITWC